MCFGDLCWCVCRVCVCVECVCVECVCVWCVCVLCVCGVCGVWLCVGGRVSVCGVVGGGGFAGDIGSVMLSLCVCPRYVTVCAVGAFWMMISCNLERYSSKCFLCN